MPLKWRWWYWMQLRFKKPMWCDYLPMHWSDIHWVGRSGSYHNKTCVLTCNFYLDSFAINPPVVHIEFTFKCIAARSVHHHPECRCDFIFRHFLSFVYYPRFEFFWYFVDVIFVLRPQSPKYLTVLTMLTMVRRPSNIWCVSHDVYDYCL